MKENPSNTFVCFFSASSGGPPCQRGRLPQGRLPAPQGPAQGPQAHGPGRRRRRHGLPQPAPDLRQPPGGPRTFDLALPSARRHQGPVQEEAVRRGLPLGPGLGGRDRGGGHRRGQRGPAGPGQAVAHVPDCELLSGVAAREAGGAAPSVRDDWRN